MIENTDPDLLKERATFGSHVMQLATAAFLYMGAARLPGTEKVEVNLPMAKLTIDTLDMLRTKTEGNRTEDETSLLDDVLYQLRLVYVKAETAKPAETAAPAAGQPAKEQPESAAAQPKPADEPEQQ
jgi:hypothetical protein